MPALAADLLINALKAFDEASNVVVTVLAAPNSVDDLGETARRAVGRVGRNSGRVAKVFEETKRQRVLIGKGGLYGNVIRTGLMLNSTKDHVDEMIAALDAGLSSI